MSDICPGSKVYLKWAFTAQHEDELSVNEGETATVESLQDDWISVKSDATGRVGLVPFSYVELWEPPLSVASPPPAAVEESSGTKVNLFDLLNEEQDRLNSNGASSAASAGTFRPLPISPQPPPAKLDRYDTASTTATSVSSPAQSVPQAEDERLTEEITRRFEALKARFAEIDTSLPVAEVVQEFPSSVSLSPAKKRSSSRLLSPAQAAAAAQDEQDRNARLEREKQVLRERKEAERIRLQKESELRAQQELERMRAEETRRKAELDAEIDRIRRHSAVIGGGKKSGVDYIHIANERYQQATVALNARKIEDAFNGYKNALENLHKAFENGQVTERAKVLADMELILEILSKAPFSTDGSFKGKLDILAKMSLNGYDVISLGKDARDRGEHYEKADDLSKALAHYKAAAEYFLAFNKALTMKKQLENTNLIERVKELVTKCEELKQKLERRS